MLRCPWQGRSDSSERPYKFNFMVTNHQSPSDPVPLQDLSSQQHGLQRQLSGRQLTMIAIGGAIGTGLFLGSGVAVQLAGPGVLVTYGVGAIIALIVTLALAEMTVVRPVAGSFGVHADEFLHPWRNRRRTRRPPAPGSARARSR